MNRIQKTLGSAAVASIFMIAPFAASADTLHASSSAGVIISPSGIVRVIGADVTAVGTGVINAVLNIGNAVVNIALNVSGDTKIAANGSKTATTTDVKVGDKVAFKGTLSSSTGSSLTVNATKVRDVTSFPFPRFAVGTISSINTVNNSFVVGNGHATTTVLVNGSTAITLNGATSSLGALPVNSKVIVSGTQNTDGSITATKVVAGTRVNVNKDDKKNSDNADKGGKNEHAKGIRAGLKLFGGLHLGLGKDK